MPAIKLPFNVSKQVYTMATVDGANAEIEMYGDIVESVPINWWTGEPEPGKFITLDEFLEDLKSISRCKEITIRMHSYGGDAGVSNTIHNRIRELARDGANLICIVDGVAMSGGSLIMCACDTVRVNPSSLIMIHQAATLFWGTYNASELEKSRDQLTAYDKMQIEIYKRKTGLSDTVIRHMMEETTFMTGREAVDKGFANELLEDAKALPIAASADGRSLFVGGRQMHLAPGTFAPDFIPTVKPEERSPVKTNTKPEDTGNEGGNSMTLEKLRKEQPDLVARIEAGARAAAQANNDAAQAVSDERARMQAIDEIARAIDPAMVQEAKYGATACSAAELALRAAKAATKSGKTFLADMMDDAGKSGANQVGSNPADDPNEAANSRPKTKEMRMEEARAQV